MTTEVIAKNLLRLRVDQELSQDELATKADISVTAYKNIESGSAEPKLSTLQALAAVLDVSLQDLLSPVRELRYVRFRADKKMKRRSQVLSYVSRWLENYEFLDTHLEGDVDIEPLNFLFQPIVDKFKSEPKPSNKDEAKARAISAAEMTREILYEKKHLGKRHEPIWNICGLLEKSGIKICTIEMATDSFFGLSIGQADGGPAIVINTWDRLSVERKIFTAAHELGHLLLHYDAYNVDEQKEDYSEEEEANFFASYFLMPKTSFDRRKGDLEGSSFVDLVIGLKTYFSVSYQSVLVRLSDSPEHWYELYRYFTKEYEEETGKTLTRKEEVPPVLKNSAFDNRPTVSFAPVNKKAEEPDSLSDTKFKMFEEARLEKLVRAAVQKDLISVSKAAEILELDIEHMRKRIESWNAIRLVSV